VPDLRRRSGRSESERRLLLRRVDIPASRALEIQRVLEARRMIHFAAPDVDRREVRFKPAVDQPEPRLCAWRMYAVLSRGRAQLGQRPPWSQRRFRLVEA
jgi:hypothetical protein